MAGEHACAAPGCLRRISAEKLMCINHWKALPRMLQREVNATWPRYRRDPEPYLAARRAAIDYWAGRQPVGKQQETLL